MPMTPKVPAMEFAAVWRQCRGHVPTVAKMLDMTERSVLRRRLIVEQEIGIVLSAGEDRTGRSKIELPSIGIRRLAKVTGVTIVFSDAHFRPGENDSVAYLALLKLIEALQPALIIDNGDSFDFPTISRHPAIDYSDQPSVADEIDFVRGKLAEIEARAPRGCILARNLGNHDGRFVKRLANEAPEFANVHGFSLDDHLSAWDNGWSLLINDTVMVKHRFTGGIHATYNNALRSGVSMVTGHLHRLCVTPWSDYNGTRWGVDCGTLSAFGPDVQKFTYSEDNPANWASGLAVLTFDDHGRLLPPELCMVIDGKAYFRGKAV